MLVLSRKENESIIINDNIEIKIVSLRPDQVKLGIIAPKKIKIYRSEIYEDIQQINKESAVGSHKIEALKDVLSNKVKKNKIENK